MHGPELYRKSGDDSVQYNPMNEAMKKEYPFSVWLKNTETGEERHIVGYGSIAAARREARRSASVFYGAAGAYTICERLIVPYSGPQYCPIIEGCQTSPGVWHEENA